MESRTSQKPEAKANKRTTAKSTTTSAKQGEKKSARKVTETAGKASAKSAAKASTRPSANTPKKSTRKQTVPKKSVKAVAKEALAKSAKPHVEKAQKAATPEKAPQPEQAPPTSTPPPVVARTVPDPAGGEESPAGSTPPVFVKCEMIGPDGSKRPGWEMWIGDHCFGRADNKDLLLASFERLQSPPSSFHWREVRNRMPMRGRPKVAVGGKASGQSDANEKRRKTDGARDADTTEEAS